ncbi:transient receptor potential cation channel subfamily A member 1-like [Diadema antillarum]|uniref:transient receptor potential cation channel subfamily A member 1-like n=1 Tax=Diadema antillarum TaxID=105358 RepID=UPI003A83DC00
MDGKTYIIGACPRERPKLRRRRRAGPQPPVDGNGETLQFSAGLARSGQLSDLENLLKELNEEDVKNKINEHDGENYSALHYAAQNDNVEMARLLVLRGADVYARDNRGRTPLHIAASDGNSKTAAIMLEMRENIDTEREDKHGMTPLLTACFYGKTGVALMLINKGAKLHVWDKNYDTPLHFAVREGNKEVARKIMEKGKQDKCLYKLLTEINRKVVAPIHEIVRCGHQDLLQLALEHFEDAESGQREEVMNYGGDDDNTPLHEACIKGHLGPRSTSLAPTTIEKGAIMSLADDKGLTPLQTAAKSNSFHTLIALLQDNRDAAAKLLKWAAEENMADTLDVLLRQGDKLHGVRDRDITKFIHGASKNGHTETVLVLIQWNKDVVNDEDRDGNTALHHAAEAGHDVTVQELIKHVKAYAVVSKNYNSRKERTPLHYAAANGWIRTINLLLSMQRQGTDNNDTNNDMTPLHLACKNGHIGIVKLLVYDKQASILLRDTEGLNCLDHAIDNGHMDVAKLLVNHEEWLKLMSVCTSDEETGRRKTPMRKLIKNMPEIAKRVMDRCVWQNCQEEPNRHWMEFYYELLEDSFAIWESRGDSEEEAKQGEQEKETCSLLQDDERFTPTSSQCDSEGHPRKDATPYTTNSKEIALNHPLNIMVSSERTNLLEHPLVTSLLNHKWSKIGPYFCIPLVFYLLFVVMLTCYVLVIPPNYYVRFANATEGVTWLANGEERWAATGEYQKSTQFFGYAGSWLIIVLAILHIIAKFVQLCFQRSFYDVVISLREFALYILAILLVYPVSRIQCNNGLSIPLEWQWQCGTVAVFLAWINLILFIRRFYPFGIYVIMFLDILRTFMLFVPVLFLFIMAFALAFYTLLMNQESFNRFGYSFATTFVMMIGNLNFWKVFHSQNYLNTENTLADGEKDYFLSSVFYQKLTYVIFTLFLIVMSILIMNLLVGLAVGDVHAIQERAKLYHLKMQVEMVMKVQQALPICIWRSAVIRCKRFNVNPSGNRVLTWMRKQYRDFTGTENVLREACRICNENHQGDLMQESVATDQLLATMKHRLKQIHSKVETIAGTVNVEMANHDDRHTKQSDVLTKQAQELATFQERLDRIENKIDKLLSS